MVKYRIKKEQTTNTSIHYYIQRKWNFYFFSFWRDLWSGDDGSPSVCFTKLEDAQKWIDDQLFKTKVDYINHG